MKAEHRKSRNGSMNKEFKFPPTSPASPPAPTPAAALPSASLEHPSALDDAAPLKKPAKPPARLDSEDSSRGRPAVIAASSIEVPAPPPMEKEKSMSRVSLDDSAEDDVGDTVDIPLN